MAQFRDNNHRPFLVAVTIQTVKECRAALGVDLLSIFERPPAGQRDLLSRLAFDPVLLVDVLFVTCRDQCTREGITDEAFGRSLAGDALADATRAFMEALTDFFPPGQRPALKAILARMEQLTAKGEALAVEKLNDPRVDQLMERMMAERLEQIEAQLLDPNSGD